MNHTFRTLQSLDPEHDASREITEQDESLLRSILELPAPVTQKVRRPVVRRVAVVGVAAAAIVGLGLARIDIGGHGVGSSPAAAAVLERAADAALTDPALVVKPGQYLKLTLTQETWGAYYGKEDGAANKIHVGSDGLPVAYKSRETWQRWIPYETSDDWIVRERTTPLINVSKDSASYNQASGPDVYSQPSWSNRGGKGQYLPTYDPAWYAALPRDPDQLLARLKKDIGAGDDTSPESLYVETFSEVLRSGIAPADIRAILFKTLADRADMQVVKDVANLDGRHGVALQFRGSNWQMLFDAKSGEYIGGRATSPDFPDVPGLDAAKTTFLTTSRAEVVNSAPQPD